MGILDKLFRKNETRLLKLPTGSFTIDRDGRIVTYTLPQSFPQEFMDEIGKTVLNYFKGAQSAQMPVNELIVHYPAFTLSARSLRGGAIIFLTAQAVTK